jgi:hypothetical protein
MSLRLLPFRQYDENDVVNIFALETGISVGSTTGTSQGDNGVFVKVSDGNFNQDTITYGTNSYLGKTDYPFVGGDMYPTNPLTITGAENGDLPLGVTLLQTAETDENGEKLLYNVQKKEELQAVLPGQSVPVLTKGIITLAATAFEGSLGAGGNVLGSGVAIGATAGKISGVVATDSASFGTIIGTGSRTSSGGLTDQFAGEYMIIKFG